MTTPKIRADLVIAIDGPVGSGKSSVAKRLAERLGYLYLDTGAMYRAITLACMRRQVDLQNHDATAAVAKSAQVRLERSADGSLRVWLDNTDVSIDIRTPEVTRNTSSVCDSPGVRDVMSRKQRELSGAGGVVLEGRDTGSVVCPDATFKFYLDGDLDVRVKRRFEEYCSKGIATSLEQVKLDICERDRRDKARAVGALKVSENAEIIDSTAMDIDTVVEVMYQRTFLSS